MSVCFRLSVTSHEHSYRTRGKTAGKGGDRVESTDSTGSAPVVFFGKCTAGRPFGSSHLSACLGPWHSAP